MEISFFENIDKIWKLKSHLLRDLRCKGENWCLGSTIKKKRCLGSTRFEYDFINFS